MGKNDRFSPKARNKIRIFTVTILFNIVMGSPSHSRIQFLKMSENFTSQTLQWLHKVLTSIYKAVYNSLPHCPDLPVCYYILPCSLCSSHTGCFAVLVLSTWNTLLLNSHMAKFLPSFKSVFKHHPQIAHGSILFKLQTSPVPASQSPYPVLLVSMRLISVYKYIFYLFIMAIVLFVWLVWARSIC